MPQELYQWDRTGVYLDKDFVGWRMDPIEQQKVDMMQQQEEQARQRQELAEEAWGEYREGVEKANEETREDREDILARLETYEEGYNEDWISSVIAREKTYWDQKKTETMDKVAQTYANERGLQPSPYLTGQINRQMTAQAAEAIQERRFELERERDQRKQWALQMRNKIYSDTQRRTMDPSAAFSLMQNLGAGSQTVAPERAA